MAAAPPARRIGFTKEDKDKKTARLTVVFQNLIKNRDVVNVQIPKHRDEPLVVTLNGEVVCEKRLPADVITKDSSWKVKFGKKGEVKIKLRKVTPDNWMGRWSPSRDSSDTSDKE